MENRLSARIRAASPVVESWRILREYAVLGNTSDCSRTTDADATGIATKRPYDRSNEGHDDARFHTLKEILCPTKARSARIRIVHASRQRNTAAQNVKQWKRPPISIAGAAIRRARAGRINKKFLSNGHQLG
jgi:hypothetical protein